LIETVPLLPLHTSGIHAILLPFLTSPCDMHFVHGMQLGKNFGDLVKKLRSFARCELVPFPNLPEGHSVAWLYKLWARVLQVGAHWI